MSEQALRAQLLTVGEVFGDSSTSYTVPIYQRNYAWGAEQIEQLLRDVQDAIDDNEPSYFLGNLVVTARGSQRVDYEVIDGQQRLTTLYLLLAFLDGGNDAAETFGHRLRYQSRRRSSEALRRVTSRRRLDGDGSASVADTDEDLAIHEGYNVIEQFMDQHVQDASRSRFAEYLRSSVTVVRTVLPGATDLNRYFEVMNTRGQQLQQVDIVKARLMSRLEDDTERACFARVWDACADMDSYVQMSLTPRNTRLRTRLFGADWDWLEVQTFEELSDAFSVPDEAGDSPRNRAHGTSLRLDEALLAYAQAKPEAAEDDEENVRFRSTIEFPTLLLHVLKVWRGDVSQKEGGGLDDKQLVRQFRDVFEADDEQGGGGASSASAPDVRDFLMALLRCRNVFDAFVIKRQFTATNLDEGDWSLQRLVRRANSGRGTPAPRYINTASLALDTTDDDDGPADSSTDELLILQSMLRVTYTSPRTMNWITLVLSTLQDRPGPGDVRRLGDALRDYARERVRDELDAGEPKKGFDIARIVFTYLDYLLVLQDHPVGFRFVYRNSIEHFYPQSPDVEQSGDQVSAANLDLFGNLALVSVGANSKFSNSLPRAKAENYGPTIERQSPKLQRMATTTRSRGWEDRSVLEHHEAMIELIQEDLARTSTHERHEAEGSATPADLADDR